MKLLRNIILLVLPIMLLSGLFEAQSNITTLVNESTIKPWTNWWWMRNSVTKEGISKNLQAYHKAEFGGMHIIPIYREKGDETNFIEYLSQKWMDI